VGTKYLASCFLLLGLIVAGSRSAIGAEKSVPALAVAILEAAISALDSNGSSCNATEPSTQDASVLDVLRTRSFDIAGYSVGKDVEIGIEHNFILKKRHSEVVIGAYIIEYNAECINYTFSKIVE
jgi:hypothetical protein